MFDKFHSDLMKVVDDHIPLKQLSRKTITNMAKPWITSGIRVALRIKNNLYKRYIKTRSLYYFSKFKLYRNKLNRLIKISKADYYSNYFTLNKNNMKNVWRGIKQIISIKSKNSKGGIPSQLVEGESILKDSSSIAHAFNSYFANIGKNFSASVKYTDVPLGSYMPQKQSHSIFFNPITYEEIELKIIKLNPSKATSPFSVPVNILKLIMGIISNF